MAYEKIKEEQKEDYLNVMLVKNNMPNEKENQKAERIRQAKEMLQDGYSLSKVSEILGVCERTIRRYSNADPSGSHGSKGMRRTSILDKYKDEILILASKGQSSTKIYAHIKEKGFTGAASTLRKFLHGYSIGEAQPLSHDEKVRIVRATPKSPKADGLACPEIDGYNDHKKSRERKMPLKDARFTG